MLKDFLLIEIKLVLRNNKQINSISEDLVKFHIKKVNKLLVENISFSDEYNISDIYSLYWCLNYIINDLWEDEFETIIWENLYLVWYKILQNLKNYLT